MANPSKRKGTNGENRFVVWCQRWWAAAERRALRGAKDCGDISGTPYVHSVKFCESWPVHKWLAELVKMRANANAMGWISARRSRGPWVHIVPDDVMQHLLDAAHEPVELEKAGDV